MPIQNLHLLRRWPGMLVSLCILSVVFLACKKSPVNSTTPPSEQLSGIFNGSGELGGGATNVRMEFAQDSLLRWVGGIRYRGIVTYFEGILLDSTQDTVRFTYHRSDVFYEAWATITATGLTVHFTSPVGVPVFAAQRELDGANMSGAWNGLMYSTLLGQIHTASMTMDQQGQLFYGTLTTVLWATAQFQLNSGVSNPPSFQLSGTSYIGTDSSPCLFYGSYVTADSIVGNWQLGQNGSVDQGSFALGRSYN